MTFLRASSGALIMVIMITTTIIIILIIKITLLLQLTHKCEILMTSLAKQLSSMSVPAKYNRFRRKHVPN